MDFLVEIYDLKTNKKLRGDDTSCRVTILDEDFPGIIGFMHTDLRVPRGADKVDIML